MTCSYMEGNVPKLIIRDIFRGYIATLRKGASRDLIYGPLVLDVSTLSTRPTRLYNIWEIEQCKSANNF
jgi:hypothetical protein